MIDSKNKRKGMPTWNQIKEYWLNTSLFRLKGVTDVEQNFCFACLTDNFSIRLERSHIKAICVGGDNHPSNLHLLCSICHKDSEHLGGNDLKEGRLEELYFDKTQSVYWNWFFERTEEKAVFSSWLKGGWCISSIRNMNFNDMHNLIEKIVDLYKHDDWVMKKIIPMIEKVKDAISDEEIRKMCQANGVDVVFV